MRPTRPARRAATLVAVLTPLLPPNAAAAFLSPGEARTDTVFVANDRIRVGFDAADGRLLDLRDRATGQAFVGGPGSTGEVWLLDLPQGSAKAALSPGDAGHFEWERLGEGTEGARLTWTDFGLATAPRLRVVVTVRAGDAEATTGWSIALEGLDSLGVERMRFPRITGIPSLGDGEALAVPRWMGQLARDARAQFVGRNGGGRRQEWPYPGTLSIQMLALYAPGTAGLYVSADDTLAYRKSFALWGDGTGALSYELTQELPDPSAPKARWAPAYTVYVGSFEGDWLDAVERYRAWGTRQRWARESRLNRGVVPEWLRETGMWVWNRGRSPGVVPPALALREALGLPVSIYWHWWHHGEYDVSFPDYLPPREGVDSFEAAVRAGKRILKIQKQWKGGGR